MLGPPDEQRIGDAQDIHEAAERVLARLQAPPHQAAMVASFFAAPYFSCQGATDYVAYTAGAMPGLSLAEAFFAILATSILD
eukprot:11202072-Lingulodinium_polyedra.AAC.1